MVNGIIKFARHHKLKYVHVVLYRVLSSTLDDKMNAIHDVTTVANQRLSSLFADFLICDSCLAVERVQMQGTSDMQCLYCNHPIKSGSTYFPLSIHNLIDMMQEFYHMDNGTPPSSPIDRGNHKLAVVIFFCSLGEVLLQHFLEHSMEVLNLPRRIRKRLLNDNLYPKQRVEKLFPDLTGKKLKATLKEMSATIELDYTKTLEFYLQALKVRNIFLHEGNKYAIPSSMPQDCLKNIWPMISMFVRLHNRFVAKIQK